MNKLLLCFLAAVSFSVASAQKVYFIYIQSESEQPFYIKINEKIQSSSASGYVIISKLKDSTYNLSIGFPQNKWPEQNFTVALNRKDQGFLLKNFGDKGWGLFNLQTLTVDMPSGSSGKTNNGTAVEQGKEISAFTETLSKAADDPSLKEKPVRPPVVEEKKTEVAVANKPVAIEEPVIIKSAETVKQPAIEKNEEPKAGIKEKPITEIKEEARPVIKEEAKAEIKEQPKPAIKQQPTTEIKEETKTITKEEPKPEIKESPVVKTETAKEETVAVYKMAGVSKRSESSTTEGFGLVYLINYEDGITDTVRLLIPNSKQVVAPSKEEVKEEKKMLDIPVEVVKMEEKPADVKPIPNPAVAPAEMKPPAKTNCTDLAAETDFFKLRKQMAAVENEDEMIVESKEYFKNKCFTTAQIKNLGALFLTDEGKYKFFDTAYTHTSDTENFGSLQTELKEEYYINRFRAMLRN